MTSQQKSDAQTAEMRALWAKATPADRLILTVLITMLVATQSDRSAP